jgi:hypothetical protein
MDGRRSFDDAPCSASVVFTDEDSNVIEEFKVNPKLFASEEGIETLLWKFLKMPQLQNSFPWVRSSNLNTTSDSKVYLCPSSGKTVKFNKIK